MYHAFVEQFNVMFWIALFLSPCMKTAKYLIPVIQQLHKILADNKISDFRHLLPKQPQVVWEC